MNAANGIQIKDGATVRTGTGDPENNYVGNVGDLFLRSDGAAGTTTYEKTAGNGTATGWVAIAPVAPTYEVKVEAADAVPGFLVDKIIAAGSLTATTIDQGGGNLGLQLSVTVPPAADEKVKTSAADPLSGYLETKDLAATGITIDKIVNPAEEHLDTGIAADYVPSRVLSGSNVSVVPAAYSPPWYEDGRFQYQQPYLPGPIGVVTNAAGPEWDISGLPAFPTTENRKSIVRSLGLYAGQVFTGRVTTSAGNYSMGGSPFGMGLYLTSGGTLPSDTGVLAYFFGLRSFSGIGPFRYRLEAIQTDLTGFALNSALFDGGGNPIVVDISLRLLEVNYTTSKLAFTFSMVATGTFGSVPLTGTVYDVNFGWGLASSRASFGNSFGFGASEQVNLASVNDGSVLVDLSPTPALPATGIYGIGDPNVDGSWRHRINGTSLVFERRESGVWVQKGAFVP